MFNYKPSNHLQTTFKPPSNNFQTSYILTLSIDPAFNAGIFFFVLPGFTCRFSTLNSQNLALPNNRVLEG